MRRMKRLFALAAAVAALVATPVLAGPVLTGPPAKRPTCQVSKAPVRDARRVELCRRQAIPPVVDPTPMFLIATAPARVVKSDLS